MSGRLAEMLEPKMRMLRLRSMEEGFSTPSAMPSRRTSSWTSSPDTLDIIAATAL
jgi:hypothetical protein